MRKTDAKQAMLRMDTPTEKNIPLAGPFIGHDLAVTLLSQASILYQGRKAWISYRYMISVGNGSVIYVDQASE